MKSILILSSVLMTFAGGELVAQDLHSLQQGVRIRIQPNEGHSMVGSFLGVRDDSLRLSREGADSSFRSYPLAGIRGVDVSRGRRRGGDALVYSVRGFVAGAAVGVLSAFLVNPCPPWCGSGPSGSNLAAIAGLEFGGFGILVGSIYGAAHSREIWETVPVSFH